MGRLRIALVLAVAGYLGIAEKSGAATDAVKIEQGLLTGTVGNQTDVRVFRGVPFAAPPVGELRWKAPQPPAAWKGRSRRKKSNVDSSHY